MIAVVLVWYRLGPLNSMAIPDLDGPSDPTWEIISMFVAAFLFTLLTSTDEVHIGSHDASTKLSKNWADKVSNWDMVGRKSRIDLIGDVDEIVEDPPAIHAKLWISRQGLKMKRVWRRAPRAGMGEDGLLKLKARLPDCKRAEEESGNFKYPSTDIDDGRQKATCSTVEDQNSINTRRSWIQALLSKYSNPPVGPHSTRSSAGPMNRDSLIQAVRKRHQAEKRRGPRNNRLSPRNSLKTRWSILSHLSRGRDDGSRLGVDSDTVEELKDDCDNLQLRINGMLPSGLTRIVEEDGHLRYYRFNSDRFAGSCFDCDYAYCYEEPSRSWTVEYSYESLEPSEISESSEEETVPVSPGMAKLLVYNCSNPTYSTNCPMKTGTIKALVQVGGEAIEDVRNIRSFCPRASGRSCVVENCLRPGHFEADSIGSDNEKR